MQAQDPNDPQYYRKSRASLRQLYGSRAIDARAPQAAGDTTPSGIEARKRGDREDTPSGREREMLNQGKDQRFIDEKQKSLWESQFLPLDRAQSPMGRMAAPIPEEPAPIDIFSELSGGGGMKFQGNPFGSQKFQLAPQNPPSMQALTAQLSQIPMPRSAFSSMTPARPSVLKSASRWLQPA